jgi:hypothetical protein
VPGLEAVLFFATLYSRDGGIEGWRGGRGVLYRRIVYHNVLCLCSFAGTLQRRSYGLQWLDVLLAFTPLAARAL